MRNDQYMKKMFCTITVIATFLAPLYSDSPPKQAVNICAVAIPVLNMYVINYEYLYTGRHGLAARLEYNPMSGSGIDDATGIAVVLDYRWHLSPELESFLNSIFPPTYPSILLMSLA